MKQLLLVVCLAIVGCGPPPLERFLTPPAPLDELVLMDLPKRGCSTTGPMDRKIADHFWGIMLERYPEKAEAWGSQRLFSSFICRDRDARSKLKAVCVADDESHCWRLGM